MSDGEAVAAGDDGGHVYVLGVVDTAHDDDELRLDVIADWQVDCSIRSMFHSIIRSFIQLASQFIKT